MDVLKYSMEFTEGERREERGEKREERGERRIKPGPVGFSLFIFYCSEQKQTV